MTENDTSLEEFLITLKNNILDDTVENSFKTYEYKLLTCKNKLYVAVENYEKME